jgi:diguanylate cyclase (GGDEF)-like protein
MDVSLYKFMEIGLPTIIGLVGFAFLVAAALLLLSYLQQRHLAPLGLWSLSFGLGATGTILLAMRGQVPDFWSILVANALVAAAYGAMWAGARRFDGRGGRPWAAIAGVAVWLAAMQVPEFYAAPTVRSALMAAIGIGYTVLTVIELWRSRGDGLPSRWPAIVLLLVHALAMPARIPLVADWLGTNPSHISLFAFAIFESVLLAMAGAYLFGSLVREKVAASYRWAASVDALTGVANRRAFLQQGTRLLQRACADGRSISLLLFDIDHFKKINDAYGHPVGDVVLKEFCDIAKAQIRPVDLFGRIGGEEFACLLFDGSAEDAALVAERVRFAFEGAEYRSDGKSFGATVSTGIATARPPSTDLPSLLDAADRALYRAKRGGRNRIEADASAAPRTAVPSLPARRA